MEMIISYIWEALDCTINHLSLNLTATKQCLSQNAARSMEQCCCLRKTYTEDENSQSHGSYACLFKPKTWRLQSTLLNHSLVSSQEDSRLFWYIPRPLIPPIGHKLGWCSPFPGLTLCGELCLVLDSLLKLNKGTDYDYSFLPHFFGGGTLFPTLKSFFG